jgi:glycolate oxidase FAD binding subunit
VTSPTLSSVLDNLPHAAGTDLAPDVPAVAPATAEDVAAVMAAATREGARVMVLGTGTHQGYGYPVAPDVVVATTGLTKVVDYEPDDLTLTVQAGVTLDEVAAVLATEGQTAVLPEDAGTATTGGVVAAGLSGWRRRRYGPTRDRVIEVELVTGDGRVVHAGGRVVKNVTGYDISRLATGSLGSLGIITMVTFKLWPGSSHTATIRVDAPAAAAPAFRPLAVLEEQAGVRVLLGGTDREVAGYVDAIDGKASEGLDWPDPPSGAYQFVMRLPAATLAAGVALIRELLPDAAFVAAHGVGDVRIGADHVEPDVAAELRSFAEKHLGSLVVADVPDEFRAGFDPWGALPDAMDLQRRVKAAFDPLGVCNPGRLPGRL